MSSSKQDRIKFLKNTYSRHQLAVMVAELEAKPIQEKPSDIQQIYKDMIIEDRDNTSKFVVSIFESVVIPYIIAAMKLIQFPALIDSIAIPNNKSTIQQILQGYSKRLAEYVIDFRNKSNPMIELGLVDETWIVKRDKLIDDMAILTQSIGDIETARTAKKLKLAIAETIENVEDLTGTIHDDLLEYQANINQGSRPHDEVIDDLCEEAHRLYKQGKVNSYAAMYRKLEAKYEGLDTEKAKQMNTWEERLFRKAYQRRYNKIGT